jgi:diguanylate cyclase (GGDEF)-like protein
MATTTLLTYVILRNGSSANWILDLLLFNAIALMAVLSIFISPIPDDHLSRFGVGSAISLWTLGSVASSIDTFFTFPFPINLDLVAELCYAIFYPLALFGLLRALRSRLVSRSLEFLDTLIIAMGCTTILAAFLIRPAMTEISGSKFQVFLAILYPVGDIILFGAVLILFVIQKPSVRNLFTLLGVGIYALSDFYFLYISQSGDYQFGSLTDIGWLLGFILIAEGFWHPTNEEQSTRTFNPTFATIALLGSSAILAISVLQPAYFPRFIIAPAFATIALSFLRMGVAINDARNMSNEQILARTDELTGLANRRKFMTEFESFVEESGSVLILDLDGFKPVNDTRGHDVGDQLLKQVARRFERVIPHGSLLARLGGDEFGALIKGNEGRDVALALRATLSYPFTIDGVEIALDVSVGEARNSPGQYPTDLLLRRADIAMYEAKRSKAGVVTWHEELGVTGSRL